ncbi:hypothetical protein Tsubulata_030050 [Turnera subulata]|uniref:Uncharacterized protein n=1 Tax=Turnera subulata TaxID=218843 RepID=A0A9Q0FL56_9ROSI|nr:hypothetical protein Tsubulata_030050 [Turnera subulata]
MGFEELQPIFAEPRPEWAPSPDSDSDSAPLPRFLMHVFAPDINHLKFHVTDYRRNTFEAVKSVAQLEDLRDSVGIGGSWSDFVDYLIASIKSHDVRLVLDDYSHSRGAGKARVVAQKSKGMPLISISLTKLADTSSANDAMAYTSFELFKAWKCTQDLAAQEQEHSLKLERAASTEKEKNENIHSQLGKRQKAENNYSKTSDVSAPLHNGTQDSPDKVAARDPTPKKVTNRIVPAFRRAKVRGALLQDTEDDEDN